MDSGRIRIILFFFCSLPLLYGCYYPVVLTGENIETVEPEDNVISYTLKNGREFVIDQNMTRTSMVYVQNDTLIIRSRVEYYDRQRFQFFVQRIPVKDISSIEIQRLDNPRSTYYGIIAGLVFVTITLGIITGSGDLLSVLLDIL
ncbi:MAG: hypothetical protein JSV24_09410 [Bacteroidales bacterium]|nr:MAG: hypothetical protein JSV24_09410 [Bacteroidales bacterium]